jgi:hypothetical protein
MVPRTESIKYRILAAAICLLIAGGTAVWAVTRSYVPGVGVLVGLSFCALWRLAKQWDARGSTDGVQQ